MENIDQIAEEREKWGEAYKCGKEAKEKYETDAGIPVKELYTPLDVQDVDYLKDIGFPGQPPYTRGVYPTMYRGRLWTIRMFSGHGTPEETNEWWKMLYREGGTGFSAAMDGLTFNGVDPDDEEEGMAPEVGKEGVPLYCISSFESLIKDLPIDKVSVAFPVEPIVGCNITSMFFNAAMRTGVPLKSIMGTTQNDILSAPLAVSNYKCPKANGLVKLACDLIEFCTAMKNVPKWNPINFTTYNPREGGIDAVQEIGFGFASAIAHIEEMIKRGWTIKDFVPRFAFHLSAHKDFFEEIAKYRAARRIWYKIITERYGTKDPQCTQFRFHIQTAGSSLTAQQPLVNVVRTTYQALAAVLGGCQSMHTNSYDEAICLPTEEAVTLAVRTQQVLQEEAKVTNTIDPLGGSYYIEWLTNEIESRTWKYIEEIERIGGMIKAFESGWIFKEMTEAFHKRRKAVESGEEKVIGVNCYVDLEEKTRPSIFRTNPRAAEVEIERLRKLKQERDQNQVQKLMDQLRRAIEKNENVMPTVMELTGAGATNGEITKIYREMYGIWQLPIKI